MIKYDDMKLVLSKPCRRVIDESTFREASTGVRENHSFNTLALEDRDFAIAYRLPSKMVGVSKYTPTGLAEAIRKCVEQDGCFYLPSLAIGNNYAKANVLYVTSYEGNKFSALDGYVIESHTLGSDMSDEEQMSLFKKYKELGYRFNISDKSPVFKLVKRFTPKCTHLLNAYSGVELDGSSVKPFVLVV